MPYKIEKRGDQHCVIKVEGGKLIGCHDTPEKAKKQMAAIAIREHGDAQESEGMFRAQEVVDFAAQEDRAFNDDDLTAEVTLVRPGVSKNGRNWKPAALKRAHEAGFWNGTRMFMDHQDPKKPPFKRPFGELLSGVESTTLGEDGRVIGHVKFFDEAFYKKARRAQEYMGVSLDVRFRGTKVRQPGGRVQEDVEELVQNNSVDWVVFPAAGGAIDRFLTAQESEDAVDWEDMTPEMVQQNAPALYSAILAQESRSGEPAEGNKQTAASADVPLTAEAIDKLVSTRVQEGIERERTKWEEDAEKQSATQKLITDKINGSALPTKTKQRLVNSFGGAQDYDEDRVQEAIDEAKAELEEVAGPLVRGMGVSKGDGTTMTPADKAKVAPTLHAVESALYGGYAPGTERAQEGKEIKA